MDGRRSAPTGRSRSWSLSGQSRQNQSRSRRRERRARCRRFRESPSRCPLLLAPWLREPACCLPWRSDTPPHWRVFGCPTSACGEGAADASSAATATSRARCRACSKACAIRRCFAEWQTLPALSQVTAEAGRRTAARGFLTRPTRRWPLPASAPTQISEATSRLTPISPCRHASPPSPYNPLHRRRKARRPIFLDLLLKQS